MVFTEIIETQKISNFLQNPSFCWKTSKSTMWKPVVKFVAWFNQSQSQDHWTKLGSWVLRRQSLWCEISLKGKARNNKKAENMNITFIPICFLLSQVSRSHSVKIVKICTNSKQTHWQSLQEITFDKALLSSGKLVFYKGSMIIIAVCLLHFLD